MSVVATTGDLGINGNLNVICNITSSGLTIQTGV